MEIYELSDKELKINILIFSELHETQTQNTEHRPYTIRKLICEQNEKFNKEIDTKRQYKKKKKH